MNKYIYRILAIVMAIAMVFGMTACGGNTDAPETTAASTAAPTTEPVNVCATEGHAWVDATCEAPKTCSVCGETEGEALEHTWIEANYQQPKTCSVCNATEGEPVTAGFETNGWEINVTEIGKEYDYVTACYEDTTKNTVGKLHVENYDVFASDETHEAKNGYEWRTTTVKVLFNDENARKYRFSMNNWFFDYYTADYYAPNEPEIEVAEGEPVPCTVSWNGIDYSEVNFFASYEWSDWTDEGIWYTFTLEVLVPVGYDGVIIHFADGANFYAETMSEKFDENTLFFRMN